MKSAAERPRGQEVALFVTCLVDQFAPQAGVAAVQLLEAAGCRVVFPDRQSCCGQPAVNSGEPEAAAVLARRFVEIFEPYDVVVSPSGSCIAMVHHWYPRLLSGSWRRRAEAMIERTHELSGYLSGVLGRDDLGARVDATVTVHDACHGLRVLGVHQAPRRLLERAGAQLLEMDGADVCCGFGGSFAVKHAEISVPLADDKLDRAEATGARWLVACDAGCLLHLATRRSRTGLGPQPVHLAELLASGLPAPAATW